MHSDFLFISSPCSDGVHLWQLIWIVEAISEGDFIISAEMLIESEHARLISTWSLNLSHNVSLNNMSHWHMRSIKNGHLLETLSLTVDVHVILHLLGRMQFLIGVQSWLLRSFG